MLAFAGSATAFRWSRALSRQPRLRRWHAAATLRRDGGLGKPRAWLAIAQAEAMLAPLDAREITLAISSGEVEPCCQRLPRRAQTSKPAG